MLFASHALQLRDLRYNWRILSRANVNLLDWTGLDWPVAGVVIELFAYWISKCSNRPQHN